MLNKFLESYNNLHEKFFPSVRDRRKEAEAAERFKSKKPPCLNGCASGFEPNFITSSMILCPANWEYAISDFVIPHLYKIGIDTPNKITLLNCLTFRLCAILCAYFGGEANNRKGLYWCLLFLLPLQQIADCADGQMARRYGLSSDFGAWFDYFTDDVFVIILACILLYKVYTCNDSIWPFVIVCFVSVQVFFLGNCWIHAEQVKLKYHQMSFLSKAGMIQMMFFSYYLDGLVVLFLSLGWLH